jgi:Xaa-Pro aminopeptidase
MAVAKENSLHAKRLERLRHFFNEWQVDALLIEDPLDLFYLTGEEVSLGQLLIDKKEAFFLVDNRYYEGCKTRTSLTVFLSSETPLIKLLSLSKSKKTLGFDCLKTSYLRALELRQILTSVKKKKAINIKLVPINNPIGSSLRVLKDSQEVRWIKEACCLGSEGFDHLISHIKSGITEEELARQLKLFWLGKGGQGEAFSPIIAFGANSAIPHHRASKTKLKKGDTVLIDIGVRLHSYTSDMTRVLFFGEPSQQMKEIYHIVHRAQKEAVSSICAGLPIDIPDKIAREVIENAGYGKYFTHSIGHGLGLEVHEAPKMPKFIRSLDVLKEGMILTIEPGIYLPGLGGIRIEDTILVTNNGSKILTPTNKDIIIIK